MTHTTSYINTFVNIYILYVFVSDSPESNCDGEENASSQAGGNVS